MNKREIKWIKIILLVGLVCALGIPLTSYAGKVRMGGWVDTIKMSVVSRDQAVEKIQSGEIDIYVSDLVTPADFAAIEAAGLEHSEQTALVYELTLNPAGQVFSNGKLNPFASVAIREAMNWLIDRDFLNQEVYGGHAEPKWVWPVTGFPDYERYIDVIQPLEAYYAYDQAQAVAVITAEMETMGAMMVDGQWTYNGEPVELIFLIRNDSDGTRIDIGNIISDWMEEIGFSVIRQYGSNGDLQPIWLFSNPDDGLWHLYTGAWGLGTIQRDQGGDFQFLYTQHSAYALYGSPLWQSYEVSTEGLTIADALANLDFTTLEERESLYTQALQMQFDYAYRIWLINGTTQNPWTPELSVSYNLGSGVDINPLWPYTLRYDNKEGGLVKWASEDILIDPINPVNGSNWTYDYQWYIATRDFDVMIDPNNGLNLPQRLERAEVTVQTGLPVGRTHDWVDLSFEDEIAVPGDVWVDWDAENQVFITADEKFPGGQTALVKVVYHYPTELWNIQWHDGSLLTLADFLMCFIMRFDRAKPESAIYDASAAGNLDEFLWFFKGFRILSENPLVIEYYTDEWELDAEQINTYLGTALWPDYGYGEAGWHVIAIANNAEAAGELAYSAYKSDALDIEHMNILHGNSLGILSAKLEEAAAEGYIPYEPTLSHYITTKEAKARYKNLGQFFQSYNHYWVGTGPYILETVRWDANTLILTHNPDYIDPAGKWLMFNP